MKSHEKNLVFIGDLCHTGQIWPQILDGLATTGWKIRVLTPKMSLAQKKFFDLNYKGKNWEYIKGVKFKSPYRPLAGYPRLLRLPLQIWLNIKHLISKNQDDDEKLYENWKSEALELLKAEHFAAKFDYIISSSSPIDSHLIAQEFSEINKIPWAADYRDLWSLNHNLTKINDLDVSFETKLLQSATFCITTSKGFSNNLKQIYSGEIIQLHNGFSSLNRKVLLPKIGKIHLTYPGQIWKSFQDISPLLLALNELQDSHKDVFELNVSGWAIKTVKSELIKLGFDHTDWVTFGKVMNLKETLRKQRDSDLLILLFSNNSAISSVLLTKLYEYLASGTPILAIGSNCADEVLHILEKSGNSKIAFSKDEIKEFLIKFAKDDVCLPDRNTQYIENFSRMEQGKILGSYLSKII